MEKQTTAKLWPGVVLMVCGIGATVSTLVVIAIDGGKTMYWVLTVFTVLMAASGMVQAVAALRARRRSV